MESATYLLAGDMMHHAIAFTSRPKRWTYSWSLLHLVNSHDRVPQQT